MNRGRLKLIVIFAAFLGPLLAAFVWYYGLGGASTPLATRATTNHAPLISPPLALRAFSNPIADGAADANGAPFDLEQLKRKWNIAHLLPETCEARCRQALYNTRQARLALGRDAPRVRRIVLGATDAQLANLAADHPDAIRLLNAQTGLENQLTPLRQQRDADAADAFLIDPLGNVMMRLPTSLDPRDLIKDLKKLMKLSRIG